MKNKTVRRLFCSMLSAAVIAGSSVPCDMVMSADTAQDEAQEFCDGEGGLQAEGSDGIDTTSADEDSNEEYCEIVFDGNGSNTGTMDSLKECTVDGVTALAANQFKRTGYQFVGWNTRADGKVNSMVHFSW